MLIRILGTVLSLLVLSMSGCGFGPAVAAMPPDIQLVIPPGTAAAELRGDQNSSIPTEVVLYAGQGLIVRNEDQAMHYLFDLPISPGESVRKTFSRPGRYVYVGGLSCSVHKDRGIAIEVKTLTGERR